jgi:predicted dehydrogenase
MKIAIIGCGLFTQLRYLPALAELKDAFEIVAVYSHGEQNANKVAGMVPYKVDIYHDNGLDELLKRKDISAVIIVAPIHTLGNLVIKSLQSGKHVLSEKPLAATLDEAKNVVEFYEAKYRKELIWSVAENYRTETAIRKCAELSQQVKPITVTMSFITGVSPEDKFLNTWWRKNPTFNGGFLFDAGVHHLASLRLCLGNSKCISVSALTQDVSGNMDGAPDTINSILLFENGVQASFNLSYGANASQAGLMLLQVVGKDGIVELSRQNLAEGFKYAVTFKDEKIEYEPDGVKRELEEWSECIQNQGDPITLNANYIEALHDVAILSALLESGSKNGEQVFLK